MRGDKRVFGDTQECMAALYHESEKLDRAIEKGEITMKSVPKRDTKQIAEQNTGNRTEREPKAPTVAPQTDSAGTNQTSNGQTSNGQTAGSQHQHLLVRPSSHACKKSSPLCQSTLADDT